MGNLRFWERFEKPPKEALREIKGGRLSGKTDISPQWRMKAMTDAFGPVGEGWGYTIEKQWTEPGTDGEVFAFCNASVWWKDGEKINSVPGVGGSMLIAKESRGLHNNDEAFKMALTDAMSVAMKALGVAAAIYEGRWDGSKYTDAPLPPAPPKPQVESHEDRIAKGKAIIRSLIEQNPGVLSNEFVKTVNADLARTTDIDELLKIHHTVDQRIKDDALLPIV